MAQARQTFERRQLGLALRRLREGAGKSQQQAADALGKHRSRLVELEDGRATITPDALGDLLDLYAVFGEERETALELGTQARARQKRRAHVDLLPGAYQRFADLEASATEISAYEFGLVPGLLQSLGYVRATIDCGDGIWWTASPREREERIRFRLDRHATVLGSTDPKSLCFVLTEDALRGRVGSHEVMREQRRHILSLLDSHADLSVRVLPSEVSDDPARGNGFSVFGFGDQGPPVGFCSVAYGPSTYLHHAPDTAALLRGFQRVSELALDVTDSAELIRRIDKEN